MSAAALGLVQQSIDRRPRFSRHDPPAFRLTTDDLTIIHHVGDHRFLRSTHIIQLIGRSADKILRRLTALYHNGYLDRPHAQLDYSPRVGSAPIVYALGNKGATLYAGINGTEPVITDWTDKNRDISHPYIEHALLISDFMVALECAVRSYSGISLLSARDLWSGPRAAPPSLTAMVPGIKDEVSVTPDKIFAIEFSQTGHRNYFAVEADRSTMPVERRSLAQSSFKKKLLAYHHGHKAKQHTRLWGFPGFRMLTLIKSQERMGSMLKVLQAITGGKGSNVFLFAHPEMLSLGLDPLKTSWTSGKGQQTLLLDLSKMTGSGLSN